MQLDFVNDLRCWFGWSAALLLALCVPTPAQAADADDIARALDERLREAMRFEDGSKAEDYRSRITFDEDEVLDRIKLDCIPVDPDRVEVRRIKGRYTLIEGRHWIDAFGTDKAAREAARWGVTALRFYKPDRICHVGRKGDGYQYILRPEPEPIDIGRFYKLLMPGTVPRRPYIAPEFEFCRGFDPAKVELYVEHKSGKTRYFLMDGKGELWHFQDRETAEEGLALLRIFRFRKTCHLGRHDLPQQKYFTYMKR